MKVSCNTLNPKDLLKLTSEIVIMLSSIEKKISQTERNSADGQTLLDGLMMVLMMKSFYHKPNHKSTSENKFKSDQYL